MEACTKTATTARVHVTLVLHKYVLWVVFLLVYTPASDQEYRYLSSFMEWVEDLHFCPLLSHHDVSATVEVVMDNVVVDHVACTRCHEKADDTKLLQVLQVRNH